MTRFVIYHVLPSACLAAVGICGLALGALADGARMPEWEQLGFILLAWGAVSVCWELQRICRKLLDMAKIQNELLAEQSKQLKAASELLRDPSWPR